MPIVNKARSIYSTARTLTPVATGAPSAGSYAASRVKLASTVKAPSAPIMSASTASGPGAMANEGMENKASLTPEEKAVWGELHRSHQDLAASASESDIMEKTKSTDFNAESRSRLERLQSD